MNWIKPTFLRKTQKIKRNLSFSFSNASVQKIFHIFSIVYPVEIN